MLSYQFVLVDGGFEAVNVTVYSPGYDYKVNRFYYTNEKEVTISLDKVKTDKDFLENISGYWRYLSMMHEGSGDEILDHDERSWLKQSYRQFQKQYPDSKADESYLERFAHKLNAINEPECIYVLERFLHKYQLNIDNSGTTTTLKVWKQKYNINDIKGLKKGQATFCRLR